MKIGQNPKDRIRFNKTVGESIYLYLEQNCEGFIPGIYSIHSLCLSFTAPAVQMEILLQEPLAQRTPWYRSLSMNHRPRQQSNL